MIGSARSRPRSLTGCSSAGSRCESGPARARQHPSRGAHRPLPQIVEPSALGGHSGGRTEEPSRCGAAAAAVSATAGGKPCTCAVRV